MSVGEYCVRDVVVIGKDESVREAAKLMREHHVGDLIVVEDKDGKRVPVGILTDRDLVVEVLALDVDMDAVSAGDTMSFELVTAKEDDDLQETLALMRQKGVRRIPVVDTEGALAGILTVDDVIDVLAEELNDLTRLISREQLREYQIRR